MKFIPSWVANLHDFWERVGSPSLTPGHCLAPGIPAFGEEMDGDPKGEKEMWGQNMVQKYIKIIIDCQIVYHIDWYTSTSRNICGLKRRHCFGIGWWAGIGKFSLNATDVTSDSTRGNWVNRNCNKDIWYLSLSFTKGWFWMTGRKVANIEQ